MKFIRRVSDSNKNITDLLLHAVGGQEKARPIYPVHASDLTREDPEFCPRRIVLHRILGTPIPPQKVPHAMRVTWDEGNDKQARMNNNYLRDYMVGRWECDRCLTVLHWGPCPDYEDHGDCTAGRSHKWRYVEPFFRHPSGFTGSVDGVVKISADVLRLIEVKIIKSDFFRDLKAPYGEHRIRTQLYLRLVDENKEFKSHGIDTKYGHIIYIMRGHGQKNSQGVISPFKEFIVQRSDKEVDRYIAMSSAASVTAKTKEALRLKTPKGICSTMMCRRASVCEVAKQCFSGEYPSVEWSA